MTDETIEEIKESHPLFADWMRPSMLGNDREMLSLRWKTICNIIDEDVDLTKSSELISYVYGKEFSEETLGWLQNNFKKDDVSFSMLEESNRVELICLSSIILYLLLEVKDEYAADIANRILTTSFEATRESKSNVPLEAKAKEAIQLFSIDGRKRPKVPHVTGLNTKKVTDDAIEAVTDNSWEQFAKSLKAVSAATDKRFTHLVNSTNKSFNSLESYIKTQDEELNVLWWLLNGYSKRLDCKMDLIGNSCKASILGIEIADITDLDTELPCLEGLLQKVGVQSDDNLTLGSRTIALKEHLTLLRNESDYSNSFVLPCHTALSYLQEYGIDLWADKFQNETGISIDKEYSSLQWAIQLYRERLIIKMEG